MKRIAQQRIFLGHQSAGMNLFDGIKQLSMTSGVPVRIAEVATASAVLSATIGHTFVEENRNPLRKLESFEHAMGPRRTALDISLAKFCYVDFNSGTDVKDIYPHYKAAIDELKAGNPGTTFVHVTAPLTAVPGEFKTSLKKLLGYAPDGILEDTRREEYNTLLRQTYQAREPIFDLAHVEFTAPDGAAISVEWKGNIVPVMDSVYTDDGEHLNTVGKLRAARELISVLASIPNRQKPDSTTH